MSIAAVAASNPSVLLLDEPTVGQDYEGLREMVDILNRLHVQSGNTMIAKEGGKELAHVYFYGTADLQKK